jgi:hypothetical protein
LLSLGFATAAVPMQLYGSQERKKSPALSRKIETTLDQKGKYRSSYTGEKRRAAKPM